MFTIQQVLHHFGAPIIPRPWVCLPWGHFCGHQGHLHDLLTVE